MGEKNYLYSEKAEELEKAVYEQKIQKYQKPPSIPPNNNKACIKMNPQKQNVIIGDG